MIRALEHNKEVPERYLLLLSNEAELQYLPNLLNIERL